ncbi:hypothetical protein [Imperialibacter sp.]|uniref:hypothetical protein n=1 Tax=Imperialibacter sp. TaxID=2038411 RepID=UPI0032ED61AE
MLSFFRINDPYRLIFVLLLLVLVRLPFYIWGIPLTLPELHWRLVGEAMAQGGHLYLDIWDDIGPLSGVMYQVIFYLFGDSRLPYYIISALLVIIQAGLFNQVLLRNKAYKENTYVPALFYMMYMNLSFDFITLSPILFSITFILLAINNIFRRIDNNTRDELFLYTGLYLGVAVLFYLPLLPFLLTTALSLALFTGSIPRRYILLFFGFSVVISVSYAYYYWLDAVDEFHTQFMKGLWRTRKHYLMSSFQLLVIGGASLLILVVSLFRIYTKARFANYQVKFQQVMFINIIAGFITLAISNQIVPHLLLIFVPPLAFFTAHYILEMRRRIWAEIFTTLVFVLVLGWSYTIFRVPPKLNETITYDAYFAQKELLPVSYAGKKIWVIGDKESYYESAALGSKYLNWDLSEEEVTQLDFYRNVENVFNNIDQLQPEVIVDLEGLMPKLIDRAPAVGERYESVEGTNFYIRRE